MGNRLVYSPVGMLLMLIFAFLLFAVVGFLFLDLARTAFTKIGFSWSQALFVLLASLLGSSINIPVTNLQCSVPMVRERYVRAFGIAYRVPVVDVVSCHTLLAVNVDGAVIPALDLHGADPPVPGVSELCPCLHRSCSCFNQSCSQARKGSGNCHSRTSSTPQCGPSRDPAGLCRGSPA